MNSDNTQQPCLCLYNSKWLLKILLRNQVLIAPLFNLFSKSLPQKEWAKLFSGIRPGSVSKYIFDLEYSLILANVQMLDYQGRVVGIGLPYVRLQCLILCILRCHWNERKTYVIWDGYDFIRLIKLSWDNQQQHRQGCWPTLRGPLPPRCRPPTLSSDPTFLGGERRKFITQTALVLVFTSTYSWKSRRVDHTRVVSYTFSDSAVE